MNTRTRDLSEFVVTAKDLDNLVITPTFLIGEFGRAVDRAYQEERASRFRNNPNLRLQLQGDVVMNSTPFDAILINQIIRGVKGCPRTPLPADLMNPRVLEMVRKKHYADSQGLVLRSDSDPVYPRNTHLAQYLAEHVDMSRVEREPALITGLGLDPWDEDEGGYGLKTSVPSEGLTIHYDDRLLEKYNGWRFDTADEIGLPADLDEKHGSRVWYTRKEGLSRLDLNRNLSLYSNWDSLDNSDQDGRVVVLGGEATAPKKDSKL